MSDGKITPRPEEEVRGRMIGRMLEEEGASCLADLGDGPILVGKHYFDERTTAPGDMMKSTDTAVMQFSLCEQFEGDDPPEDSWRTFAPGTAVSARYWRLWSGPPA